MMVAVCRQIGGLRERRERVAENEAWPVDKEVGDPADERDYRQNKDRLYGNGAVVDLQKCRPRIFTAGGAMSR